MALYQSLTSSSTPEQIAAAYKEAIASAGGDTAANQKIATDYLTNLGIATPTIQSAYQQYLGGAPASSGIAALPTAPVRPAPDPGAPPVKTGSTVSTGYAPSNYHLANVLESNEPQAFKDLYSALQSGQARVAPIEVLTGASYDSPGVMETQFTVLDAKGKPIPGVNVDPSSGRITLPSAGGFLYLNTPIGQGGTLAPVTDFHSQVGYQGGRSQLGGFVRDMAPVIGMAATAFGLPGIIGSTLAPAANAATQAAIGGAAMGGGMAAATGQNVLKGAVLGGGLAYAGSSLGQALSAGVTDTNILQAAADADMAAGMLPEFGTNAAYDSAMANLMAGSPGAVQQLQNVVDSQVGGRYGPDNIDVGGGWNPAGYSGVDMSTLPQADYSNEGRNYPTEASTQGRGGSPVNASMAAAGLPAGLGTLAKLAALGLGAKGAASLIDQSTGTGGGDGGGPAGPLAGYTFDPSKYQATIPDPAMFRPREGVVTVTDAIRRAQAEQQGIMQLPPQQQAGIAALAPDQSPVFMAEGGLTDQSPLVDEQELMYQSNPVVRMAAGGQTQKPQYTSKGTLAAMSPWQRALAELNNAAYTARMPVAAAMPSTGVGQLGQFASGGGISDLGSYSDGGRMLKGGGDGMSDSIPATIGGKKPARLADGEFVVPADVVSGLGNGSTDAGAKQLYKMMDRVRQARTGTKKQGKEINALKHMPA